jgi:hypothetical protein
MLGPEHTGHETRIAGGTSRVDIRVRGRLVDARVVWCEEDEARGKIVVGSGIAAPYSNRGFFGSGHGWDAGWSVAWNATSTYFLIQAPPGTENWCIGCIGSVLSEAAPGGDGTIVPNGIYDSLGTNVTPGSLYLAQLKERLGSEALHNIGYADVNGTRLAAVAGHTWMPLLIASTRASVAVTDAG